jgi:hypothetical protein
MRIVVIVFTAVLLSIMIAGCAAGPNDLVNTPNEENMISGFWRGLWHGIIAPITFIVSLFTRNVHMYEVHNNGGWYNFGFLLGVSIIFGGCGGSTCSRRSRRR